MMQRRRILIDRHHSVGHRASSRRARGVSTSSHWPAGTLRTRAGNRPSVWTVATVCIAIITADATAPATAADAAATAPDAAAPTQPPPFRPEDISIGEPISLPLGPPIAAPAVTPAPGTSQPAATTLPSVVVPTNPAARREPPSVDRQAAVPDEPVPPAAAGGGWLGISVDDSLVTGRLVVVEVAPEGPAARAGVRPQDILLAINGSHLQTGDELAAALAAIAPGQRVKMAVGRDNRISDLVAEATARPPEALTRNWQSATAAAPPSASAAPPSAAALPPAVSAFAAAPAPAVSVQPAPPARMVPEILPDPPLPAQRLTADVQSLAAGSAPAGRTALGVRTVPVDPAVQTRFRLSDPRGAFVIGVVHDLPAARAGVPPGSVIVAINRQPVRSPQDLTALVAHGPVGTPVPIEYVLPGGQSRQADVVLQSLEQPLERALVGTGEGSPVTEQPTLQAAPQTLRRVQSASAAQTTDPQPLIRLESLLQRMNARLELLERRLERLESGR